MGVVELTFINKDGVDAKILIASSDSINILRPYRRFGAAGPGGILGAGTGLCGISALKNGASSVVFTDRDDSVIEENIRKNCALNNIPDCDFVSCDWNDVPILALERSVDLIIASDCLFESSVFKPFTETLSLLLHKNSNALAYIAYENRGSNADLMSIFEKAGLSLSLQSSSIFDSVTFFLLKASVFHP
ncbi:hypothetical protein EGR_02748 [Echinococcus granulosus]|uniref:Uncharacterized protein n=1 Tax=Echinococcus granulosus TaxID=6210 RepID=W6UL98_ECHGR|nr:hypothetical protein EGR_02748 [Echinococcus granulosus]EUB62295.1 hypothetical protein EGR_02748 [Echinococcus granulosus]